MSLYPLYGYVADSVAPSTPPHAPPPWRMSRELPALKQQENAQEGADEMPQSSGAEASATVASAPDATPSVASEFDPLLAVVLKQEAVPVRARK